MNSALPKDPDSVPETPSVPSVPIPPPSPVAVSVSSPPVPVASAPNSTPIPPPTDPPSNPPPLPITNNSRPKVGIHDAANAQFSQAASGQPPTTNQSHHFPFMIITVFLVIVLAGFAGSFIFFQYNNPSPQKSPAAVVVTPPITVAPTSAVTNPFSTASADLTTNPFASPTASVNPFGSYQNPFTGASPSASPNQPYQNPFTQ